MSDNSANFRIGLYVDDSELRDKVPAWEGRVNRLNRNIDTLLVKAKRSTRKVMSAISSTAYAIQGVLGLIPGAINPVFTAILTSVTTTIASLHAIAAAYAAGGVTIYLTAIVEGAAIGLSILGVGMVLAGRQDAAQQLQEMSGVLRSIDSATRSWGRAVQSWQGD